MIVKFIIGQSDSLFSNIRNHAYSSLYIFAKLNLHCHTCWQLYYIIYNFCIAIIISSKLDILFF